MTTTPTTPKKRPILFSAPMVRAILEGRKTQTRRIIRPQPKWVYGESVPVRTGDADPSGAISCPQGAVGDRLWVKETWHTDYTWNAIKPTLIPENTAIHYPATSDKFTGRVLRPSLFMRRWMSRITLEITSIRVEPLKAISEEDALAEGVTGNECLNLPGPYTADHPLPSMAYANLWESINGKGSWIENPYVWVIEFRRVA